MIIRQNIRPKMLAAIAEVNTTVGEIRKRFITELPGQQMLYLAKEREAAAYLALDPEPETLDGFPLLAAEVGLTAPTAYELAQTLLFMSSYFSTIAAPLETLRLSAVYALEASTSAAEIEAILTGFRAQVAAL